jgi:hypothetical protein
MYSYRETSGGQSCNLYLNVVFSTPVFIRHLWQLKTVFFMHWCLLCAVLLALIEENFQGANSLAYYVMMKYYWRRYFNKKAQT